MLILHECLGGFASGSLVCAELPALTVSGGKPAAERLEVVAGPGGNLRPARV